MFSIEHYILGENATVLCQIDPIPRHGVMGMSTTLQQTYPHENTEKALHCFLSGPSRCMN